MQNTPFWAQSAGCRFGIHVAVVQLDVNMNFGDAITLAAGGGREAKGFYFTALDLRPATLSNLSPADASFRGLAGGIACFDFRYGAENERNRGGA